MTKDTDVNLGTRAVFPTGWGLFGQWFCIPKDATEEEQRSAVVYQRETLGPSFAMCPDGWIADRFYGGFPCRDSPDRVHVYFATGQYSYIAADQGRFWANDDREYMWGQLLEVNEEWQRIGPWTQDAP